MGAAAVSDAGTEDGEALRAVARLVAPWAPGEGRPRLPEGIIRRQGVDRRLRDGRESPCVVVAAPAGYGKTTALATLAAIDPRPCAWVTLEPAHDDPTVLATHLLLSLDDIERVPDPMFGEAMPSGTDFVAVTIPRLVSILQRRARPFLLVVDDAQVLGAPDALAVVRALVDHVPDGSQVAIGTRDPSALKLGRARASRRVADIDVPDLTMSIDEGMAALAGVGLTVDVAVATRIVERAEGWPAGIHLCALALRHAGPGAVRAATSGDGLVAEYLRDEILANASPELAEFLLNTSVLGRLSGPLCDAVLERHDSTGTLEELARTNYFVTALDDRGEWFRYHHLFGELMHAELARGDPELERVLHRRASSWLEAHGDVDAAVHHAHGAADRSRVAALAWQNAAFFIASGRNATVNRWLEPLTPANIAAEPAFAVTKSWVCLTEGDADAMEAWTARAETAAADDDLLSDGTPVRGAVALLRAIAGRRGVAQARDDAALAGELHRAESPYRVVALLVEGATARLLGDTDHARVSLERTVALADIPVPAAGVQARAFLAIMAVDAQRWLDAELLVERALRIAIEQDLVERPLLAHLFAVASLLSARSGAAADARDHHKRAVWLMSMLDRVGLWMTIEGRILLARSATALGDLGEARHLLRDARWLLDGYADPGSLPDRLDAAVGLVGSASPLGLVAAPLTAAELRVLSYLPTHLSFAQIADELFVSRNTVKTQAIAVYRKLDVSSRAEAVARARDLGLVAT